MAIGTEHQPATVAAERLSRAVLALGALGLTASALVVGRMAAAWRVTPAASSHHITLFGLHLAYPTANAGAVAVLVLAAIGSVVVARAARGAVRELRAARRLGRWLATRNPRSLEADAFVIDDDRPHAFCAGLARARVYLTTGALALLEPAALAAVLEHERHHARRRDPLRRASGRVVAHALFPIPGIRALVSRADALAELSADERAVRAAPGNRAALASAMLSFDAATSRGTAAAGIDPARVDRLLHGSGDWRFPVALAAIATGAIVLIGAIGLLAGRVAAGTASLAPPFLSRQPCVVVLAAIPAVLALLALRSPLCRSSTGSCTASGSRRGTPARFRPSSRRS
jgi:Zn-dependent protease with chaperone function